MPSVRRADVRASDYRNQLENRTNRLALRSSILRCPMPFLSRAKEMSQKRSILRSSGRHRSSCRSPCIRGKRTWSGIGTVGRATCASGCRQLDLADRRLWLPAAALLVGLDALDQIAELLPPLGVDRRQGGPEHGLVDVGVDLHAITD